MICKTKTHCKLLKKKKQYVFQSAVKAAQSQALRQYRKWPELIRYEVVIYLF